MIEREMEMKKKLEDALKEKDWSFHLPGGLPSQVKYFFFFNIHKIQKWLKRETIID